MQEEAGTPTTPASGKWKIYFKADGFYFLDDTGLAIGPFTIAGANPNATELTINTDAITVTQRSHKLQPQSGTADNLSTINGTVAGQSGVLYVSDFGTDTITIKHNVGNILCVGDTDILLSNGCVFWYSNGTKIFMSGGGGGSSAPFIDSTAIIKGSSDATKLLRFEVDGFTTGNTRVLTPPDKNGTIVVTSDLKGWVEILAALPPFNNGSPINFQTEGFTPSNQIPYWEFANGSASNGRGFYCRLNRYGGGGLTLSGMLMRTSATAGQTYIIGAGIRRINAGSEDLAANHTYDMNYTTITVPAGPPNAGIPMAFTITFTDGADMDNLANGEFFELFLLRDHATDTASDICRLLPVSILET